MNAVIEIYEEAINAAGSGTTGPPWLEMCQSYLSQHKIPEQQFSIFYGRLGEALFHNGRREEAIDCARIAFELTPGDEAIADICAWIFSNCGCWDEAAAAYEQLLGVHPGWAEGHRHASGSFAAAGQLDRAVLHAITASDLDPNSIEFAVHAASQCEAASRHEDAVTYLMRAAAVEPDNAWVLRQLSSAKFALGWYEEAVSLALRAVSVARDDRINALHAAELLLRTGGLDEAAEVIHGAVAADPHDDIALRMLSAAQMLRGRTQEALDAIERALAVKPQTAEYHLHRANLLYRIGRLDDAGDAFARAAELDPANPDAKRSQLTVYYDSGRFTEALAIGAELIRTAPENEEYARAVQQVLNRRLEALDGDYVVLSERALRPRRGDPRPAPRLFEALRTQTRVIHALIIRETRTRFGDSRLGYGWALLEPILHILMLSLVFAVMMRGRPPIGDQFFIFYYTGIIPYHLFIHTSSSMTYAITANGSLLQLPLVGTFDVLMARGLVELVTDTLVAVILLAGFGAIGLGAVPQDLVGTSAALLVVWVLGCGFGFLNAVINAFTKSWDKIWAQLTRLLYFCSGIFYVPGTMPDWIRDILAWNPVLHGVDWFRSSFFREYDPHSLDRCYLSSVALAALLVGLALERSLRRRLCEPL